MANDIEEVKSRLNIVDVISGYLKLQKAGINFKARCPFHSEKTPSFFVSPQRQSWHCFGCNKGGDVISFVQEMDGVEFYDALKLLADRAGVVLKKENIKEKGQRQKLFDILENAANYFANNLKQEAKVLDYLLGRGLKKEIINDFQLGYAKDDWQNLLNYLVSKNFKLSDIESAGLIIKSENDSSRSYDRFRNRIMFPISDLQGRIVGFSGRIFDALAAGNQKSEIVPAKYINSPETPVYNKSRILYGLNAAKNEIKLKDQAILVEGQMDLIMSHQAGIKNSVATSGTALSEYQLDILRRFTNNLIVSFDQDLAGVAATKRGLDLALGQGFNIKVILISEGKDPADVVKNDPKKWLNLCQNAVSIMDYHFETVKNRFLDESPESKKKVAELLLKEIAKMPSRIEQAHWISKLSQLVETRVSWLEDELNKLLKTNKEPGNPLEFKAEVNSDKKNRLDLLAERLLTLLMIKPEYADQMTPIQEILALNSPIFKNLFNPVLSKDISSGRQKDFERLQFNKEFLENEIAQNNKFDFDREFKFCLKEINMILIKKDLENISLNLKKAELSGDKPQMETLMQEFNVKTRQLADLLK